MEKNSQFYSGYHQRAAFELAERIRIQISQQPIYVYGKLPIFVQVSIGISLYSPSYHRSIESLFKEADDALYQAKRQGRNRVLFLCNISKSSSSVMNFIQYLLFCHVC